MISKKSVKKAGPAQAVTFVFNYIVRGLDMLKETILSLKTKMISQLSFKTEQRQKSTAGFTLVEMVVVIAIIGIMTTIVVSSISGNKSRARDDKRVGDIKNMQLALEFFYLKNKTYPATLTDLINYSGGLKINDLSTDIQYKPLDSRRAYHICVPLENADSKYFADDSDYNSGTDSCFSGSDANSYYDVKSKY
ncbi:MAG: prepilin-type N-terminal cleavage/methylation domain-containing protein [bacterium]